MPVKKGDRLLTIPNQGANAHYTEEQAAELLGVSVERIRSLISSHILNVEFTHPEDGSSVTFSRSDLVVLRVLASQNVPAA